MNQRTFSIAVLDGLDIKPTPHNVRAMEGWIAAEGGHWHNSAKFNPLNTTQDMPGSKTFRSVGQGAADIRIYRDWSQGVAATVKTLRYGRYKHVVGALRSGDVNGFASAVGSSGWGTSAGTIAAAIGRTGTPTNLHGADPVSSHRSGATPRTTRTVTVDGQDPLTLSFAPDSSQERVQAAMDLLHHKTNALGYAEQISGLDAQDAAGKQDLTLPGSPAKKITLPGAPGSPAPGRTPIRGGGAWGGSLAVEHTADRVAARHGLRSSSRKRTPGDNASVGGASGSDHLTTNVHAYAKDYPITDGPKAQQIAHEIAGSFGKGVKFVHDSYASGGVVKADGKTYKVQILLGGAIGHDDHIHVGVHRVG